MTVAKSLIVLALVGWAAGAGAQSFPDSQPVKKASSWIVYKPINRIANRQLFESHLLQASHRNAASSAYPTAPMTKAVHRAEAQMGTGNIPSSGYPTWTLSKPLHRK